MVTKNHYEFVSLNFSNAITALTAFFYSEEKHLIHIIVIYYLIWHFV
jgi:hypothetical protein